MKRLKRIFLGIILPIYIGPLWATLLASVLFVSVNLGVSGAVSRAVSGIFIFSMAAAHVVLPVPAVICSLAMEYIINPMTRSNSFVIVLGGIMGLITAYLVEYYHELAGKEFLFLELLIGLLTGLTVAWILRRDYVKHNT